MTTSKRNFVVGLTVLIAILVFGWMFLRFGEKSASLFTTQTEVLIDAPRVDGLSVESPLTYQGVYVGRVTELDRNTDGNGVTIKALLETDPPVPMNVNASIVTTNLIGGGASVVLEVPRDPKTGEEEAHLKLQPGEHYPTIHAAWLGLQLNLLPSEYGATATQISRAAKQIADASEEVRQLGLVKHIDDAVQNVTAQSTKAGNVLQSIEDLIGNASVQHDLKDSIANAHKATADFARFSAALPDLSSRASQFFTNANTAVTDAQIRIDDSSKQLGDGLTKLSVALDDIHGITEKINKGDGTAGQVLNDPKLYQNLLESSRELDASLQTLHRILDQWEQDGIAIKTK